MHAFFVRDSRNGIGTTVSWGSTLEVSDLQSFYIRVK